MKKIVNLCEGGRMLSCCRDYRKRGQDRRSRKPLHLESCAMKLPQREGSQRRVIDA